MAEGKNLIGVDIGTSSIKVCELKQTRKGVVVRRLGYEPVAPQVIVDGQVMDASAITESLQKIFRDQGIRKKEVAISVSGQSAIIRKISVPLMTDEELQEQIQWEAEQHIPFDIKDVLIDHQVLTRDSDQGQMEILLVAAKRDQIEDYAQIARTAKLRPIVCDIDAFAFQNLFETLKGVDPQVGIALLNVGSNVTSLNILHHGTSAFSREIASGGSAVTEEIEKSLSISKEQANAYKCGDGQEGIVPQEVLQIIEGSCDSIAAEVQRSLDFYMATGGDVKLARLYLTGGTANLTPLAQAVENRVQVPVETWMPLEGADFSAKKIDRDLLSQRGLQYAVACGLALRKDREVHS